MTWLMLIFLIPVVGLIVFLIIGSPKLPPGRRKAQDNLDKAIRAVNRDNKLESEHDEHNGPEIDPKYTHIAKLSQRLASLPAVGGNKMKVMDEYDKIIDSIVVDINKAKKYIHLEYYILAYDETTLPLIDALGKAVERGVRVRVMYDWLAAVRTPKYKKMKRALEDRNIKFQSMLAFKFPGQGYVRPDLRNHRKLIAIDGQTGYVGSQNLIARNYHRKDDIYYDELVTRIEGPVVLQLSAVFITDWYAETGDLLGRNDIAMSQTDIEAKGTVVSQMLPSGPGYNDENNLKVFTELIHTARKSITIANPYFVPDEALMTAITSAVKRGVKVTMINSEAIDQWMVGHAQRSFYEELLKAGVKIHLYKAPILLHSKYMTIDDETSIIGSSNLDIRSFLLDLEVTMICYDKSVTKQLARVTEKYLARSKPVTLKNWMKRPVRLVVLDNIARLTSALQ